jgi:hypothetical protein
MREFPASPLGQRCPQACPYSEGADDALGVPLTIREATELIGCSTWTVRQTCIPAGLPHVRLARAGKLTFYRNQVIRWLMERQQKGGRP